MSEIDEEEIHPTNWNLNLDFLDAWKFSKIATFFDISIMDNFNWMKEDYRKKF
jgi:hypothetical protein